MAQMNKRYFLGITPKQERIVFRSAITPASGTFGQTYAAVIGPFRTKRAAVFMAGCRDNPHCRSVCDAEKLSKHLDAREFVDWMEQNEDNF